MINIKKNETIILFLLTIKSFTFSFSLSPLDYLVWAFCPALIAHFITDFVFIDLVQTFFDAMILLNDPKQTAADRDDQRQQL